MPNFFIVQYPEPPILVPNRGKVTIGRADNNTIVLTDPRVSRLHAQIEWREFRKEFVLSDLGSSNGTFLNGNKIPSLEERALHDWDKIRVTSAVLTIRFVEDPDIIKNEFNELRARVHCNVTEILEVKDIINIQQVPVSHVYIKPPVNSDAPDLHIPGGIGQVCHLRRPIEEFLFVKMLRPDLDQKQFRRTFLKERIEIHPAEMRIGRMRGANGAENN